MKEYDIEITETLQQTVTVKANSQEEAQRLVEKAWANEDHILDSDNFVGVDFKVIAARALDRQKKPHEPER